MFLTPSLGEYLLILNPSNHKKFWCFVSLDEVVALLQYPKNEFLTRSNASIIDKARLCRSYEHLELYDKKISYCSCSNTDNKLTDNKVIFMTTQSHDTQKS
ncbi:hypothetical protein RCL_jg26429.t1 [Rhizophagus clarus]|uniref:Uncharacterized protein n=1 Tax=Rhizophagus clarus TaxID=94130 RepID=A0A8H3LLM1_9GLOM|nr:hypothetical protein RCL_jg26429.t1 [Rhizophagus clarus]